MTPSPPPAARPRDLLAIVVAFTLLSAAYLAAVRTFCGEFGFPLDDAFIHLQFARNLRETGQMAFNPGVPSSGCTAPLYAMLLAGAQMVVGDWYRASFALGALCALTSALLVYRIALSWTGRNDLARWAGLLAVVAQPTVISAYCGMESPVYTLAFLMGLSLYTSVRRRLCASAVFALGVWLRPELAIMAPFIFLDRLLPRAFGKVKGELIGHVAIWAAIGVAYIGYHYMQDGSYAPSTFAAKAVAHFPLKPDWLEGLPASIAHRNPLHAVLAVLVWPPILMFLTGLGIATVCPPLAFGLKDSIQALWKDDSRTAAAKRLAVISIIGYPLARALVDPTGLFWFQGQRYFAHLTPLAILLAIGAIPVTQAFVAHPRWNWQILPLAIQQKRTLTWAFGCFVLNGMIAVLSVSNIQSMQVATALWLRDHTRQDQIIATNDIGAIGFITRRPILDTVGLIEPDIVRHYEHGGSLLEYLKNRRPSYLAIFPLWYPEIAKHTDLFDPVHTQKIDFNVVCGGRELVCYRAK